MSEYKLTAKQIDMFWYIAVGMIVMGFAFLHPGLGLIVAGGILAVGVVREEMEQEQEKEDAKKEEGSLEI